ncbi:MAG: hypothetical protein AAF628_24045 [Planctomycetota bacterium]
MQTQHTICVAVFLAFAAGLLGQSHERVIPGPGTDLADAAGISVLDGAVLGVGPGYRASFERSAVTVSLAAGREGDRSLRFELTGAGRERGPALAIRDAHPDCTDGRAVYDRGALVERYEARAEGVKQSFVFPAVPPGQGDLVVTGRIVAPPRLHRADPNHVELGFYARPLLRVSDVVGVDATGATVPGTLLLRGDVLEMRLPAEFVDRAVAPLVLDPFIGPAAGLTTGFEDTGFDVAYDETHDVYLVVWLRVVAGGIHAGYLTDALGQRFRGDGTRVGGLMTLSVPGAMWRGVLSVANVNGADAFVVGYGDGVRAVGAATGAASPPRILARVADVAGDARLSGTQALAVARSGSTVVVHRLNVTPGGADVTVEAPVTVAWGGYHFEPRLPAHGGQDGRFLLVWGQGIGLEGAVIDVNTMTVAPPLSLSSRTITGVRVDGDGRSWVVAFERLFGRQYDVVCRTVTWSELVGSVAVSPPVELTASGADERISEISWLGGSVVVAYRREFGRGFYDGYLGGIDPFTCLDCEGEVRVDPHDPFATRGSIAFAGEQSGSLAGGSGGLAVWNRTRYSSGFPFTSSTSSFVAPFRSLDGSVSDLGGGCGRGGTAVATCALTGKTEFYHRARDTFPAAPTLLLLGAQTLGLPCGPCSIVPDPLSGVALPTTTSAAGHAALRTPIPASSAFIGASLLDQWLTLSPTPQCSIVDVDLSNAIRVTIEGM